MILQKNPIFALSEREEKPLTNVGSSTERQSNPLTNVGTLTKEQRSSPTNIGSNKGKQFT